MVTVFLIFKNNFIRQFSDKKKFLILLIFPVLSIIISIFLGNITNSDIKLGIVNESNNSNVADVINLLENTQGISAKIITNDHAKRDVIIGNYDAILTFNNESLNAYNLKDKEINDGLINLVSAYKLSNKTINFDEIVNGNLDTKNNNNIISFLFIILLITGVANCSIIIKDKEDNVIPRYLYSPNKLSQYIMGIGIYNFVITLIQIILSFIIGNLVGKLDGISISVETIYAFSLTLIVTSLSIFIVSMFSRELLANLMSATISIILALLGGAFIPYSKMPKVLQNISMITPNRWIIKMTEWFEEGQKMNVNPVIILISFALVFVLLSTFIFSHKKVEFK
jgi:ABC-2 type transport system permease protein